MAEESVKGKRLKIDYTPPQRAGWNLRSNSERELTVTRPHPNMRNILNFRIRENGSPQRRLETARELERDHPERDGRSPESIPIFSALPRHLCADAVPVRTNAISSSAPEIPRICLS